MVKERLLNAGEVASYLSCSVSTVRRLAGRGELPYYKLGKMVRFRRGDIEAWLLLHREGEILAQVKSPAAAAGQLSLFDPDLPVSPPT